MEYETPAIEVVGTASESIQASFGPRMDGDGYAFSQGFACNPQEE
jgi:hypothetical protein